eukprot:jgi/Pico_ML_1/54016/g4462.t1
MYDVAFKYAFKAAKIYLDRKDAVYDPWGTKLCRLCVQCGAKVMEREPDAFRAGLELCKSIPEDIRLKAWKENRDKGASQSSDDDDDDDKGTDAVSLLLRGMLLYNETYRGEGFLRTREKWERSTTKHRKSAANEAASLHRTIVRSAMVLCGSYIHTGVPPGTLEPGASKAHSGHVNEAILVILKGMEREGRETGGTHGLADGLSNLDLDASVAPEPSGDDFFRCFLEENGHKLLDASTRKHLFEFLLCRASEVKAMAGAETLSPGSSER